jgi:hypothetical protein
MSGRLRIFQAGAREPLVEVDDPGTVELVFSAPVTEERDSDGYGHLVPITETRRQTIRLGDLEGPVRIQYEPPAPAPAVVGPVAGDELIEVEVDKRGWSAEQRKRYGVALIPHRITMTAAQADRLGKSPEQIEAEARKRETAA